MVVKNTLIKLRIRLPSLIIFAIISAAFLYLLRSTWMRWGDLIIDTSRELYLPVQILEGKILYRDIYYEYGPFPPYFMAAVYNIFGIHINSLIGAGIAITASMCFFIYKVSRFFLERTISCLVVLNFLFVFAFGNYQPGNEGIFNFILPYSSASTFFILFVIIALFFFLKFISRGRKKYLWLWSIFSVLNCFVRPDMFSAVWFAFFAALLVFTLKQRAGFKLLWYPFGTILAAALGYFLFFAVTGGFDGFKESVINTVRFWTSGKYIFAIKMAGLDNIPGNILMIFKSLFLYCWVIFLLGLGSIGITSFFRKEKNSLFPAAAGISLILFAFLFSCLHMNISVQYRCLSLLLPLGALLFFIASLRYDFHDQRFKKNIARFVLFSIALSLILRIFFLTVPYSFAFFILDAGLICFYIIFYDLVKDFLTAKVKSFSRRIFLFIFCCYFLFLMMPYWAVSYANYSARKEKISTGRGTIYWGDPGGTKMFRETVAYLKENTPANAKVVVVPEGASINFFSGRRNHLKYSYFTPVAIWTIGEEKIIASFKAAPADYIVLIFRPTREAGAGSASFGIDYARKLYAWIRANYKLIKQFGPFPFTQRTFTISTAIFKKISP
jgi:hypothetical protein